MVILCRLGGNPVCKNQSFLFPDICSYSGRLSGPDTWQQPTSCSNQCYNNTVLHPTTCNCSYPYICNMFFAWTPTFGLDGARIGHLRRTLSSGLNSSVDDLWIENAIYQNNTLNQLKAKALFYPPAGAQKWDRSQVTSIESKIVNKTFKLPDYDPYELTSSNLQTMPSNEGTGDYFTSSSVYLHLKLRFMCYSVLTFSHLSIVCYNTVSHGANSYSGPSSAPITSKKSNHQSLPIVAGVIGGFVALVLLSSLLICVIKRRRTPNHNHDNASGN